MSSNTKDELRATLEERGKRYGNFNDHARVTQGLKAMIFTQLSANGKVGGPVLTEGIDMICHKLGRIACGDPLYRDSWVDIAGYAMLVADSLPQD